MYCKKCGRELLDTANFCVGCGSMVVNSKLIGFSNKINDPSFDKYKKDSKSWSYIFSFILAIIAIIAFPIYGKVSGDIDWPYSLYYGFGIGGMFIIIAFFQSFKRNHDKAWDGIVIDKQIYKKRNLNRSSDTSRIYYEYVLTVKRDTGKKYKHKWRNQSGLYNYYDIGDKVRHHKGFMYYEKYDKSKDKQIMCIACMAFNNIKDDYCIRCKRPLLKH